MYQLFITLEGGSIELIYQYLVPSRLLQLTPLLRKANSSSQLALTRLPFALFLGVFWSAEITDSHQASFFAKVSKASFTDVPDVSRPSASHGFESIFLDSPLLGN